MTTLLLLACGNPVAVQDYLAVVHVAPSHGSANVAPETTLSITFNDDLDEATVPGAIWVEDIAGTPITAETVYDVENRTLLLSPDEGLDRDSAYGIVATTGVAGLEYGSLPADISTTFWTVGPGPSGGNQAPVAIIDEIDEPCTTFETVSLVGESSYDPNEEDELTYFWRIVDGTGAFLELSREPIAAVTPNAAGRIVIGLVVDDGQLESSEAFVVLDCED
ncbi:MAG: Ig-like domain-containing protein [Proteobacteria bacterium]|nr:Ig-like domain-containing protein [Pseudomonadota bacterium]MCP4918085.1 Ig-like domain-containing protein [Pseudomonadota bacterium]